MKMGEEGKLFADDALPAIMRGLEKSFGGGMEKANKSFSGQLEKMKEGLRETFGALSMPLFDKLKEIMPTVNAGLEKLTTWFQGLSEPMQRMISFGLILAPVLLLLAGGFLMFVGFLPTIIGFIGSIGSGFAILGGILSALVSPVGLIIAAIIGLGAAFVIAYQKLDWFRAMVDAAWAWIKNAFFTALEFIKGVVMSVMSAVGSFIGEQLAKFKALWDEHGTAIMQLIQNAFTGIQAVIIVVMGVIKGIFQTVWPIISNVVKVAWELIKTVVGSAIDIVVGLIDVAMSLLKGDWEGAWDAIKGIAEDIWHNIEGFFENIDLVQIGKDIIDGLISGIKSMGGAVKRAAEAIADSIPDAVKSFLGIHSPSRVLMKLGGYTAEGLAVGIGKGIGGIQQMAGAMANAAVPNVGSQSLNYGLAGAGGSAGSPSTSATNTSASGQPVVIQLTLEDGRVLAEKVFPDINRLLYNETQNAKARRGTK